MIVAKFGGTSVGSAENIKKVIQIVKEKKEQTAIVVSALGGVTNLLIEASDLALKNDLMYEDIVDQIEKRHFEAIENLFPHYNQTNCKAEVAKKLNQLKEILHSISLLSDLSDKTSARIVSLGEIMSSFIIHQAMLQNNVNAALIDSRDVIKTDDQYLNAEVDFELTQKSLKNELSNDSVDVFLFPGFISSNELNETTTLGRGGSDYTAAIIANAADANILEIWTDVSGMYTANPKLVRQAYPIEEISYQEAMELSHFGAKVLYPPTVQPVLDKRIPILIKNTLSAKDKGTLITKKSLVSGSTVKGISHIEDIALLTLEGNGMVGVPGISERLFGALAKNGINVKFITQASSEHSICIAIDRGESILAKKSVDKEFEFEIFQHKVNPLIIETELAIIALVGDHMKSHQGISGRMFSELGANNVNIRAIAQGSTEKNISAVISENDVKKALNTLHAAFFEDQIKQINLFVVGIGNVGGKLLEQIKLQSDYLLEKQHLQLRVVAISNSRKMLFEIEGIDLNNWTDQLDQKGEKADLEEFIGKMKGLNLRNSVFVDNTANDQVPELYASCLSDSIAVVACNKIACSSAFDNYQHLKYLSRKYNAPFLFETNVGAGLPIIDTLNNLIASGDEITEIQAVLSGSLNFVFNHFNAEKSFAEVVDQAGIEGYTEPDPRIDLSGVDVMRKILILMRESGLHSELEDIKNESFLPQASLDAVTVPEFLETLVSESDHFNKLRQAAENENCRLKYVASYKDGKASVGLQHIPKDHPFYNLDGKDNIVLFYTNRYKDQPLIIKGAGAGADVTASGIFGDIIRTGNK
ncbi:bifunctional aspartate kinase/homoserine dehydrogenase I [Lutimonas zeaxanthinifaciens]|uniref:bifunctional aspartate kinase/homoserine dehydrogenase I n=1 Tax=Lutimonas zeaxanthinifaciens TaxID=3060215 RepID=UPI00265D33CD|nr:bifunctional aspartate kinase/homoserine dehydrogenase I [Lutimonas sp. YSD2104]WKK67386.1 bifunctional aspartate kinase/homoserine dehydrogenase I [Lutimonas sp. YSD2104]